MEAGAAECGDVSQGIDVAAASVAFAGFSPHPLALCGSGFPPVTSRLAAEGSAAGVADLHEGTAAVAWVRRLKLLCLRERLRLHLGSLEKCFSPLYKQVHVLVSGAAAVSATCGAAAQQLQQTLTQRQPVLRALQLLQDRRLLLQERQRLCGLLVEQLRLSSPLRQAIVLNAEAEAGRSGDGTAAEERAFSLCERFFDALQELQRIREHAAQLQRVVAPSAVACAAAAAASSRNKEEAPEGVSATRGANSSLQSSSLRRRALAEAVLQQAGELQELAYERLYLWLQQECRTATVAAPAAKDAAGAVLGAQPALDAVSSQCNNFFPLPSSSLSQENHCSPHRYKHSNQRRDSSSAGRTAEAAAAMRIACFFAALGATGVAASIGVSPRVVPSGGKAAVASAARPGAGEAHLAEAEKARSVATELRGTKASTPERSEELLSRQDDRAAEAAGSSQKVYLRRAFPVERRFPLVLRACVTLKDRPAYLYHCLQELLQMRRKTVAEEFHRLLSASDSILHREQLLCSSTSGPSAAAVKGDRDVEGSFSSSGDAGGGYCFHSSSNSTRLVCLKRSRPLLFLQGLLQCVAAVTARERAVVCGLRQLLLPAAPCCGPDVAAAPGAVAAAEGTAAVAESATAGTAEQCDVHSTAERTGGPQLTDTVNNEGEALLAERDALQNDAAVDILGESELNLFKTGARKDGEAAAHWQAAAESSCSFRSPSPDGAARSGGAGAAGDETQRGDNSAVEAMCSADLLEWLLSGLTQLFEKQMEEVFAAVQEQASGGPAAGERQQQRPAYTLVALVVAHLLDRQAIFLRRLLLFSSDSPVAGADDQRQQQQRRRAGPSGNGTGVPAAGCGATALPVAVVAAGVQHPTIYSCSNTLPLFSGSKSGVGAYRKTDVINSLPRLIACCEAYAEKAETLFLSLWEQQVMSAASSYAGGTAAYSSSSPLCGSNRSTKCSGSPDLHLHGSGDLGFFAAARTLAPAPVDRQETEEVVARAFARADVEAQGSLLSEVTASLRRALEILHAPLSGGPEEREATAALGGFTGAALEEYYCHAAAYQREGVPQRKETKREESDTVSEIASRTQVNTVALGTSIRAAGEAAPEGEAVAAPSGGSLVENLVCLFEPAAAVCLSAPGRRSKITGLRITDRLRPLQEDESEELDGWVESSVAPLLNFCRQETRRFSDAGDATVFLINAYACIEAPLRRFAVCRVYSQLLQELIEQQFKLLHQVEIDALLSRLGLRETLDAVRREVHRRRTEELQDTVAAGKERDEEGAEDGAFDRQSKNSSFRGVQRTQYPATLDTWDTNDDIQVGGALSPAEHCLQEAALTMFFKKFAFILYTLRSVELPYTGRLVQEKHQMESRRSVMREVVAAYAEIYVRTKHLGFTVHTPGEVALLLAA